jgi:hypothetical protein
LIIFGLTLKPNLMSDNTPSISASGFAGRAVAIAIEQWNFFGNQTYDLDSHITHVGHKEGQNGWYQKIGTYWKDGVHINGINGLNHDIPWSAAFISWVMRTAGAKTKFNYAEGHARFISLAIIAQKKQDTGAGFWCYRLNEKKPDIGDIVCFSRAEGIDYDHQNGGQYKAHSDLVVAVSTTQIEVIGGNVGDSVTRRPIALDVNGHLVQRKINGELLFGLMKNRIT